MDKLLLDSSEGRMEDNLSITDFCKSNCQINFYSVFMFSLIMNFSDFSQVRVLLHK